MTGLLNPSDFHLRKGTPQQEALLEDLFLSALTDQERQKLNEDLKIPDNWEEGDFTTSDGARLRHVFAHQADAKGLIVLLPGRAQTFHEYHEFARTMRGAGYAVASYDRRSQGKSDGRFEGRTDHHIHDFDRQVKDVGEFMDNIVKKSTYRDLPKIMIGHSMGGADGLIHLADNQGDFNAAAFLAPMWGIALAPQLIKFRKQIITALTTFNMLEKRSLFQPEWSLTLEAGLYGQRKTNDPLGRALQPTLFTRHPELVSGVGTWGLANQALKACDRIQKTDIPERIATPTLTILGCDDKITSNDDAIAINMRMQDGSFLMIDGAHQSLNEIPSVKQRTYRELTRFCNSHLSPA